MTSHAVEAHGVRLTYGPTVALDGVDLQVPRGSTLGVLGHNGAGKTSLIRVLTTSLRPDRGRVLVDGIDVVAHPARVRRSIGVTGQYAGLDDFLTTVENLQLMARLSGLRRDTHARVSDLVERFDLHAIATRRVGELSGGSRRRVDLAAGLVASPKVLFLDEPSTGSGPGCASGGVGRGDRADRSRNDGRADHPVSRGGRPAGRPAGGPEQRPRRGPGCALSELKRLVGGKVVKATVALDAVDRLTLRPVTSSPSGDARTTLAFAVADDEAVADLIARLHADTVGVTDLEVASPSLDDVFFHLTQTGAAA